MCIVLARKFASSVMLWLLFAVMYLKVVSSEDYLEVNITQGPVRGYKNSEGVFTFYGIPYATPPTGEDKFKAPLRPPTWNIPFEATDPYIACPQIYKDYVADIPKREDCLIANIFVPDTKVKDIPVLVLVHGGAYQYGYGDQKPMIQLVKSKRIIAVDFNHRLGPIGYLCLGTKDVPGNAGMKDQVALLRWVQENIAFFGGNPNDVTLYGCSAAGSAVDLHLVSKMSTGLFNKAIPQSGAGIGAFNMQQNPIENAKMFAKLLNFDNVDDIGALEEFYKKAPISLLTSLPRLDIVDSSLGFSPCIERDLGQEMFLDNDPVTILKTGAYKQVSMLYGFTKMEGFYRLKNFNNWKYLMNEKFSDTLPQDLHFKSEKEREEVAQKIKYFYFGNKTVENSIHNYIEYFGDSIFSSAMLRSIKLQTESGNDRIFFYEYSFPSTLDRFFHFQGAGHCAQSDAVLDEPNEKDMSEEHQNVKALLRDLWLNFITTGTPAPNGSVYPDWPPVGTNRSPHMAINTTLVLKDTFSNDKRATFWDEIYTKYYRKPIPPTF